MRWLRSANQGMTLMELLIALGLGASLSATVMQLFTAAMLLQSEQNAAQDLQQRSAYAQFLLRAAIRESASSCEADAGDLPDDEVPALEVLTTHGAAIDAVPDSQILRVRTADCESPVQLFYIRRSGDADSHTSLYRRRQRSDGSYFASEELIEGVTSMSASVGVRLSAGTVTTSRVAYVAAEQVDNWSQVFSIKLSLSMRQMKVTGEEGTYSLTMHFSTALRQAELRESGWMLQ